MEVLVEIRTRRRFSNIVSRRNVGRRSLSILDAVDPAFVGLFGNQIETELLADNTSEKSAHRMLLPMSGGHDRTDRRSPPGPQHCDDTGVLGIGPQPRLCRLKR